MATIRRSSTKRLATFTGGASLETKITAGRRGFRPAPSAVSSLAAGASIGCHTIHLLFLHSHIQLELPAPGTVLFNALQLERSELGNCRLKIDRDKLAGLRGGAWREGGFDRGYFFEVVRAGR